MWPLPVKVLKRNEILKKDQPVPEKTPGIKTPGISTLGGNSEETPTKSSAVKVTPSGPAPTQEGTIRYWEKRAIPTPKVLSESSKGSRENNLEVVVSAKEDTQKIIRMIKHQIHRELKKEIEQEVEKAAANFVHKRFHIPDKKDTRMFLKENDVMQKMTHRLLKGYMDKVNFYGRMLR